ncbi:hypothetical protein [Nocardioides sp. ChNu-99]|uniref:hypothetical protein n=1 Tax=Nocardioides sp. ChNu-99 TaxID=2839897 RepID=UPI002404C012|nr:hypothetical protein [Nocardioides sp. ChNu-99]MDF9717879.1 hypothetical protein [Nocardioides sp. ChNu-99]
MRPGARASIARGDVDALRRLVDDEGPPAAAIGAQAFLEAAAQAEQGTPPP